MMDKFQKRITKNIKNPPIECLVVGNGFGHLENLLQMFNTVFVYESDVTIKSKNLIHRKNIKSTFHLKNINGVFIDLDKLKYMDKLTPLYTSTWPDIFIEGDEVIPKTESKLLYDLGYNAVAKLGWCHQWRKIK
jgi:hypothetical protein